MGGCVNATEVIDGELAAGEDAAHVMGRQSAQAWESRGMPYRPMQQIDEW